MSPDQPGVGSAAARALGPAPDDVRSGSVGRPEYAPPQYLRRRSLTIAAIVGISAGAAALGVVALYFLVAFGPVLTAVGGLIALVPLGIVLLGIRWIDRWEPEPRSALAFAFLWGAGVSVMFALAVDLEIQVLLAALDSQGSDFAEFARASVQAPVVEEIGKGLGLLLLFLVARRHFDGPVDGIVYAAMIGAGFAFTENVQYFAVQIAQSGGFDFAVAEIVFVRGFLSPFAHAMFTACVGFFLGIAARRTGRLGGIGFWLLGLVPAIALHAFWNGVLFFVFDFYGYYLLVQVPMFLVAVLIVTLLRREERRITHERLSEYAAAGWFNPGEVDALATRAGRRGAKSWARQHGVLPLMDGYLRDVTRLAYARQRIVIGRDRIGSQADEVQLLGRIRHAKQALRLVPPTAA